MNPEKLFERLINNEITREEFEALLESIKDEKLRARYDEYLEAQFMKEIDAHFSSSEHQQKAESKEIKGNSGDKKTGGDHPSKYYSIAATLLVILGITAFIIYTIVPLAKSDNYQASKVENEIPILIKNTPNKRMFQTRLADGSFVHLNALSSISYPKIFAEDKREVEIQGEAYFDIKRDEKRPFTIKVKNYTIEVLGTSFNIQAYEDEKNFSVTVESGMVSVNLHNDKEPIILTQNQKLWFSSADNRMKVTEVNVADELSWRQGILRFDATPMTEVEHMLERWYGIDIIIEDESIYNKSISGIHQNENIKSVIESLTYATGTKYTIEESKIIIKK